MTVRKRTGDEERLRYAQALAEETKRRRVEFAEELRETACLRAAGPVSLDAYRRRAAVLAAFPEDVC